MRFNVLDKEIYKKGLNGDLTVEEIDKLPGEYDHLKQIFKRKSTFKSSMKMFDSIDGEITAKGFSGQLTHDEIDKLPNEYDKVKDLFHEWTTFMNYDNELPKLNRLIREFKVAKKITSMSPKNGSWLSIPKLINGLRGSRNISSPYTEDDVTPQEEIDEMLVPSPGSTNDPDWFHKCAINNKKYCKLQIRRKR